MYSGPEIVCADLGWWEDGVTHDGSCQVYICITVSIFHFIKRLSSVIYYMALLTFFMDMDDDQIFRPGEPWMVTNHTSGIQQFNTIL